ncbi:formate dehydrogenase accessory protein FdhE [Mesorhizobium sp. B2-4-12]|uniref:formate dehydrogenase accessory protein FdhE n=1 Tax=Mesorhizobium sp. B2-4-12 TaxID=2589937 RepID=UPI0011288E7C|nr:formate dehydrogenase accessory protein FdhE [Mesorhizobium sp. B2-4-12]TPK95585.1 formate dehydrogenase accessory protein FdhE [Mesorhizobium sp. B2-4-12]
MRQGGSPSTGKWQGSATGGVTSPDTVVLPDPGARFTATAVRLATLALDHPMEGWLSFMARLASAQRQALDAVSAIEGASSSTIDQAVEAGMPPYAADGHRRDPAWRTALASILDEIEARPLPTQAREVIARLRTAEATAIEAFAERFLHGDVQVEEAGEALYVAAALQVYFSTLAARLPAGKLQLLQQPGLCPCCGSTPSVGLVTATGKTPGIRYLYCSLCSTAWVHVRATCITCEDTRTVALEGIEGDTGLVRAETCNACHTYSKLIYQKQDMQADPYADDLASLGIDILVAEAGWSRHAPNPLLLVA